MEPTSPAPQEATQETSTGIDAIHLDALDAWAYGDAEGLGA